MHIDPIELKNKNMFIRDYRNNDPKIMRYFDYSPFHDYEKRVNDLKDRNFKREQLTEVLSKMNDNWNAPRSTFENIERLKNNNSVVVIGGQQAGLLTGPLYTINKIISILQFARQQEKKLNIPVIPVFWIAGEDHDFEEINHIYQPQISEMKKHTISQYITGKYPISDIEIDQEKANQWLIKIFKELTETEYTKDLYAAIRRCLEESNTYVDFFAQLIYELFNDEGLVLLDSSHPELRQIESEYFNLLIHHQSAISENVYSSLQQLTLAGYSISLDIERNSGHLFYHHNHERILLDRHETGEWIGKQEEVKLSTEELLKIANENPENLSNNVITRPIMQELLFPTLAFVGGNGEISYWSVLKQAFHELNIKMPPILPRLSFTYMNTNIQKMLKEYAICATQAINFGVDSYKGNWLAAQQNPPIHQMVEQLKLSIDRAHQPLRNIAGEIRSDLGDMAQKNLKYIFREIDYLENRVNTVLEEKYEKELVNFDLINNLLNPQGGLQERTWNPINLINEHGTDFLMKLVDENCSFEKEHFLVYI